MPNRPFCYSAICLIFILTLTPSTFGDQEIYLTNAKTFTAVRKIWQGHKNKKTPYAEASTALANMITRHPGFSRTTRPEPPIDSTLQYNNPPLLLVDMGPDIGNVTVNGWQRIERGTIVAAYETRISEHPRRIYDSSRTIIARTRERNSSVLRLTSRNLSNIVFLPNPTDVDNRNNRKQRFVLINPMTTTPDNAIATANVRPAAMKIDDNQATLMLVATEDIEPFAIIGYDDGGLRRWENGSRLFSSINSPVIDVSEYFVNQRRLHLINHDNWITGDRRASHIELINNHLHGILRLLIHSTVGQFTYFQSDTAVYRVPTAGLLDEIINNPRAPELRMEALAITNRSINQILRERANTPYPGELIVIESGEMPGPERRRITFPIDDTLLQKLLGSPAPEHLILQHPSGITATIPIANMFIENGDQDSEQDPNIYVQGSMRTDRDLHGAPMLENSVVQSIVRNLVSMGPSAGPR